MKFTAVLATFDSNLWQYHIIIPLDIASKFVTNNRRVLCTINGKFTFQCALMPDGNGQFFININKEVRKKMHLESGAQMQVDLAKDTSEYGLPVPTSFKEILNQDPEGDVLFHQLTPGKQRSLLYIIGKPKSEQIQINKGLTILEYLKEVNGKLDFKELNIAFKNSRFK